MSGLPQALPSRAHSPLTGFLLGQTASLSIPSPTDSSASTSTTSSTGSDSDVSISYSTTAISESDDLPTTVNPDDADNLADVYVNVDQEDILVIKNIDNDLLERYSAAAWAFRAPL